MFFFSLFFVSYNITNPPTLFFLLCSLSPDLHRTPQLPSVHNLPNGNPRALQGSGRVVDSKLANLRARFGSVLDCSLRPESVREKTLALDSPMKEK